MLYKIGLKFLWNRFWLYITWKKNRKYWYDILVSAQDNAHLIGKSTSLVMEIFNNYYAKNSFRGMCTVQKISVWHFSFLTVSFIFVLGFDFGSDSCVNKFGICLLALCKKNIRMTFWYFDAFLYYTFSLILDCVLILLQTAVLANENNCVF